MTYLISNDKEQCAGCSACANVCPKNALHLTKDEEGFLYPQKDSNWIECGLCERVCPYADESLNSKNTTLKVYASYSKSERVRSSSGGLFYVIGKHVIENGGVVYGAAFSKDLKLKHKKATTIDELEALRGSKYIQSDLRFTFREIREKLNDNIYVLFSGTPCQVAGLKTFLRKDYENLLTIDVVCDGVPSQWMFDQHREYLENKHKAKLVSYSFRDNQGWSGCEIAVFETKEGKRKKKITPTYVLSPYLYSFLYGYTYRLSCYKCEFAKIPRQGDLTLGDFWGIEKFKPMMDKSSGVSAVLVSSEKGERLWDRIKKDLIWEESCVNDVCSNNNNIYKSHGSIPLVRKTIYENVRKRGYDDVAIHEFRCPRYYNLKIKYFLKRFRLFRKLFAILKGRSF